MADALQRAREARTLLDSPLFVAARGDIEGRLQHLRRSVPISDSDKHTRIILMEQLWTQLLEYFEQIALTGQLIAQRQAEQERQQTLLEQGLAIFRRGGRAAM